MKEISVINNNDFFLYFSKVQESWTSHVRQQGDLFYVDVNGSEGHRHTPQSQPVYHQSNGSLNHSDSSLNHGISSVNRGHGISSVNHGSSSLNHDNNLLNHGNGSHTQSNNSLNHGNGSLTHSNNSLNRSNNSLNHGYGNQHQCLGSRLGQHPQHILPAGKQNGVPANMAIPSRSMVNGHVQSDGHSFDTNGYYRNKAKYNSQDFDDEYVELDRNGYNERTQQTNNNYRHTNHDVINQEPGDKIKHVYLSPNYKHKNNGQLSGIKLCEKMFGIKLCQYNDKSRVNYNNNVVKDRKIIVQGVVPGSAAEKCRQINRGG